MYSVHVHVHVGAGVYMQMFGHLPDVFRHLQVVNMLFLSPLMLQSDWLECYDHDTSPVTYMYLCCTCA